ncbi:GNAT family N-acetyltransferase [Paenibacillus lignilyticus]|uniref:GNAT family N-acetyltransferase n=1 Tax=Paenibacillus lignilyticus TaxID=1172615 RepID=A0ABS5CGV0_9BACL|nr:GNAT family N-acetyltransferase [Paenibacillus lignilyticus]MBP3965113.1 GNAT family N-acetyltransferase [Paenibacillus lignilyticus]
MNIREASIADCEGIAKVHLESWRTTYAGLVSDSYLAGLTLEGRMRNRSWAFNNPHPDQITLVAEEANGRIIGFVDAGKSREPDWGYEAEVYAIYLLQEAQGQGHGRRLFAAARDTMKARSYSSLMLWVLKDNPSLHFYTRLGGEFIATKEIQIGEQLLPESAIGWKTI